MQPKSVNEVYLLMCFNRGTVVESMTSGLHLCDFISLSEVTRSLHEAIYENTYVCWVLQRKVMSPILYLYEYKKKDEREFLPAKIQKLMNKDGSQACARWIGSRWKTQNESIRGMHKWERNMLSYFDRSRGFFAPRVLLRIKADGRMKLGKKAWPEVQKMVNHLCNDPALRFGGYMKRWYANGNEKVLSKELDSKVHQAKVVKMVVRQMAPTERVPYRLQNLYALLRSTFDFQYQSIEDRETKDIDHLQIKIDPAKDSHITLSDGMTVRVPFLRLVYYGDVDPCFRKKMVIYGKYNSEAESYTCGAYGYVDEDGTVHPTSCLISREWVGFFLCALDQDLWNVSGQIGKLLNACIFCQRPLSTTESLSRGFGPDCMKKWNLDRFTVMGSNSIRTGSSSSFSNATDRQETISTMDEDDVPLMLLMGIEDRYQRDLLKSLLERLRESKDEFYSKRKRESGSHSTKKRRV